MERLVIDLRGMSRKDLLRQLEVVRKELANGYRAGAIGDVDKGYSYGPAHKRTVEDLAALTPERWAGYFERWFEGDYPTGEMTRMALEIDEQIERLVAVREYMVARAENTQSPNPHVTALQASNNVRADMRKFLGYLVPDAHAVSVEGV